MKDLPKRIATALAGIAILVSTLYWGGTLGALLITMLASIGMVVEFSQMAIKTSDQKEKRWILILTTVAVYMVAYLNPALIEELAALAFVALSLYYLATAKRHTGEELYSHNRDWMVSLFALIYLVLMPLALPKLRGFENGFHWCMLFLFMVFATDTGGYFIGKTLGKHKLYELVSPKKTWEGAVGGWAACVLVAVVYSQTALRQYSTVGILALGAGMGVLAQVGDLCESLLKRGFHVKDSGNILPGHGGILDRCDSIVFSAPIMYAGVRLLQQ